ncbi:PCTP-like protein [Histomonas meleagridis]|uniref:PCTP-like protein n=1 Tax=Histomonas meleagridis TaxID=135588 RepID=UPI00355A87A3|nr:PCTP-like protein [Histomonas meleagridis]KAH0800868.1 PCTP-like protein [Histomonas meleagridis]
MSEIGEITPERIAAAEPLANQCLEIASQVLNSSDWKESKTEDGVKYYTRSVPGSSFTMIKSSVVVPRPLDKMVQFCARFREVTSETPANLRGGAIERRFWPFPGTNEHNEGFIYLALESGSMFVSNRDFVMIRKYYEKDGRHYYICVSIDDDKIRPPSKNLVRGKILCNATVIEAEGDGTRVSFIAHADPAGSIPAAIYNMASLKQGACVRAIRDDALKEIN